MDKLTTEQKAKRYDEAIGKLRSLLDDYDTVSTLIDIKEELENIFPELKESEGERIRKEIIRFIQMEVEDEIVGNKWIAWLEKQGKKEQDIRYKHLEELLVADDIYQMAMNDTMIEEARTKAIEAISKIEISQLLGIEKQGEQKPSDKNEPKFHEGDWVIYNNDICQIVKREEGCNILVTQFGVEKEPVNERNLSTAKLWDISDAKNGNVLATSAGAFIYNGNNGGGSCPGSYCGIDTRGNFKVGVEHHWTGKPVFPATKEQRDLLFAKMKKEGYVWDSQKKELRKVEQNLTKWSDEDERNMQNIDAVLFYDKKLPEDTCVKLRNFLKTLKQRIGE